MKREPYIYEQFDERASRGGWLLNPPPDTPETAKALADEFLAILSPLMWRAWRLGLAIRALIGVATGAGFDPYVLAAEFLACHLMRILWWQRVYTRRGGRLHTRRLRVWGAKKLLLPYFTKFYELYVAAFVIVQFATGLRCAWMPEIVASLEEIGVSRFAVVFLFLGTSGLAWSAAGVIFYPKTPRDNYDARRQFLNAVQMQDFAATQCRDYLRRNEEESQ